jgi:hypothetical protein
MLTEMYEASSEMNYILCIYCTKMTESDFYQRHTMAHSIKLLVSGGYETPTILFFFYSYLNLQSTRHSMSIK